MTAAPALLLAHQGGWDEVLIVLAPLLLFAGLLLVARRRVDQIETGEDDGGDDVDEGEATGPDEERASDR